MQPSQGLHNQVVKIVVPYCVCLQESGFMVMGLHVQQNVVMDKQESC
jgi:hypothetical protein